MHVGHSRRHIIWRVIVYSCAQDKLISSRRYFLLSVLLVLGKSQVIALRMRHNDDRMRLTWRERPSNMISRRHISRHDAQRQKVSRRNVLPRTRPCQIAETVLVTMDIAIQNRL
jgi:hypothetical protein